MKYLIVVFAFFIATDAFSAGRINPFNGKPITYSLSESVARDAMGGRAYDRMRMDQWNARNQASAYKSLMRSRGGSTRGYKFGDGWGTVWEETGQDEWRATKTWSVGAYNSTVAFGESEHGAGEWMDGAYNTTTNGLDTGWDTTLNGAEKGWRQSMTAVWRLGHGKWGW